MEALNHPLLAPHKDQILATAKPTAEITLTRQDEGLTLWQSKVGGDPYLPKGADYPRHPAGHALTLLAQINFAEVPKLPDFPEKGILQFFIDGTDDVYGLDYDNPSVQKGFRIVYHAGVSENIDDLVTDFSKYQVVDKKLCLPFKGQYAMAFKRCEQVITADDFHCYTLFGFPEYDSVEWHNLSDKEIENIRETMQSFHSLYLQEEHRIGGYPRFADYDPRKDDKTLQDYILLFQLDNDWDNDSGDKVKWGWGDVGVGNFFICPDDLKNLDFSKVMYNFDDRY